MKFYTVSTSYAEFIRNIDPKVPNVVDQHYQNPKAFVGIVLSVDGHNYIAPLTSPKPWHTNIKESAAAYQKMHEVGVEENYLGLINFKFMFPVLDGQYSPMPLDEMAEVPYKRMLYKQLQFIRVNQNKIESKAVLLRKLSIEGRYEGTCDFVALENGYQNYSE